MERTRAGLSESWALAGGLIFIYFFRFGTRGFAAVCANPIVTPYGGREARIDRPKAPGAGTCISVHAPPLCVCVCKESKRNRGRRFERRGGGQGWGWGG